MSVSEREADGGSSTADGRPRLGFWSLLALGINGIVGVGIFFVPAGVARAVPGPQGAWVYVATVALLLPVAAVYGALGARFGEDGGPYVWARAALGNQVAFAAGWLTYVSAVFSTAAVMGGVVRFLGPELGFSGAVGSRIFGVLAVLTLVGLTMSGLRLSARIWSIVTVLKLSPLLVLVVVALVTRKLGTSVQSSVEVVAPSGWARGLLVALFATQGFEIVPVPAGHVRNRRMAVPLATVGCLLVVVGLYVGLHLAAVASVPELSTSSLPLVEAAGGLGGTTLSRIVSVGTHVSALGIAFGMFVMTPRYLAALGERQALGQRVGIESARGVPVFALWVSAVAVLLVLLPGGLEDLFAQASVFVLVQYAVSTLSLARLAVSRERGVTRAHLALLPLALGAILVVASGAKPRELAITAAALAVGLVVRYLRRP